MMSIDNIWWLVIIVNGLFTGLGTAIGNYIANRHLVKQIEKFEEKLKKTFITQNEVKKDDKIA